MLQTPLFPPTTPTRQRSAGSALVAFASRGGQSGLTDLAQSGSAKAMLPRVNGTVPEVVFLNTSGGLTGGDRLSYQIDLGPDCRVTATTQTAERAYASEGPAARVSVRASVGRSGRLDWLPQETLIYESAHLQRHTEIDLAADASCLMCEMLVLGRQAMGESPQRARLDDHRLIRRAGRVQWADTVQLNPQVLQSTSAALLGPARAFAVVAFLAQGAEDALAPLRNLLTHPDCTAAASAWDGKCIIRLAARDGWPLRKQLSPLIARLTGRPLPRVWQVFPSSNGA